MKIEKSKISEIFRLRLECLRSLENNVRNDKEIRQINSSSFVNDKPELLHKNSGITRNPDDSCAFRALDVTHSRIDKS